MRVLGLDSAEVTGWAIVSREPGSRERLERSGVLTVRQASDVEAAVADLATPAPYVVAIEEPFVHPRNPSTGLVLARLLGRWLQACESRGLTCVTVPASMWQPGILTGLIRPRADRAERKRAACSWAYASFGVTVGDDQADAIALAAWTLRNAALPRRAA